MSRKERDARYRAKHHQRRRDYALRSKYGIGLAEFQEMQEAQQYTCAICQRERKLVVDHDHSNGTVRGLLCDGCNRGLGYFGDDTTRLRMAIDYVNHHREEE